MDRKSFTTLSLTEKNAAILRTQGYAWAKAMTEQVAYYHDLGIVLNAPLVDQVGKRGMEWILNASHNPSILP